MEVGAATSTPTNSMKFLQNKKNTTLPSNYTPGYMSKKNENINSKVMHPSVQSSIIYSSQALEANFVSIYKWMDKEKFHIQWNIIQP